jgi:hypothetical protein
VFPLPVMQVRQVFSGRFVNPSKSLINMMRQMSQKASQGGLEDVMLAPVMCDKIVKAASNFHKEGDMKEKDFAMLIQISGIVKEVCDERFLPLLKWEMLTPVEKSLTTLYL